MGTINITNEGDFTKTHKTTWANRGNAADYAGEQVFFSDLGISGYSDGSSWIPASSVNGMRDQVTLFYNRITNNSAETGGPFYDAFGNMYKLPNGRILSVFRRGDVHYSGSYGKIMGAYLDETRSTGWSLPFEIMNEPTHDSRFIGGGIAPNGALVLLLGQLNLDGVTATNRYFVARSYDYESFKITGPFSDTSLNATTTMSFYAPAIIAAGNRMIQPYYTNDTSTLQRTLKVLISDDNGETWSVGATVQALTATKVSEMTLGYCGNKYILAVARTADAGNTQFNVYRSNDNGTTWAALTVPSTTFDTGFLKSPLLVPFKNSAGAHMLALYYNNNTTGQLLRRTISAFRIAVGSGQLQPADMFTAARIINANINIGYPRAAVITSGEILVGGDLETAANNCNFKCNNDFVGDVPTIDSGWFAVAANTLYDVITSAGLQLIANVNASPYRVSVVWTPTTSLKEDIPEYNAERFCIILRDASNGHMKIQTGTYTFDGTGYGAMPSAQTGGYYRYRIW